MPTRIITHVISRPPSRESSTVPSEPERPRGLYVLSRVRLCEFFEKAIADYLGKLGWAFDDSKGAKAAKSDDDGGIRLAFCDSASGEKWRVSVTVTVCRVVEGDKS